MDCSNISNVFNFPEFQCEFDLDIPEKVIASFAQQRDMPEGDSDVISFIEIYSRRNFPPLFRKRTARRHR